MMLFVESFVSGHRQTWCLQAPNPSVDDVLQLLHWREGSSEDVVLQHGGRVLRTLERLPPNVVITATLRLPGGKGGFGSMLRAIGAQIEKTTNREACRDLSGRRLRDINEEKRLKDYIAKKSEKERELMERRKKKFEALKETPRHIFQDSSYYKQREEREQKLYDSLDKVFQGGSGLAGSSGTKRSQPPTSGGSGTKKGRFLDDLDDSSDESSEDENEEASPGTSNEEEKGGNDRVKGTDSEEDSNEETMSNAAKGVRPEPEARIEDLKNEAQAEDEDPEDNRKESRVDHLKVEEPPVQAEDEASEDSENERREPPQE
ncbi:splicing regulator SDE2 isoform X2 [Oratosquilla oratoria]|uniref:splicing regulator SDE2 isoform X2 n=1 Tax=Oratosquilla oratoria TaxID=337810 RepID=UPI003F76E60E